MFRLWRSTKRAAVEPNVDSAEALCRALEELKSTIAITPSGVLRLLRSTRGIIVLLFAIVVASISCFRLYIVKQQHDKHVRAEAVRAATPYAEGLRAQLMKSICSAYNLAVMIQVNSDMARLTEENFGEIAHTLISTYGGITNLQLAPCGVVRQIYPLQGSEQAIGHNLLKDNDRRAAAVQTIIDKDLTFVGPLHLIQGGVAIIGRYPTFAPNANCNLSVPSIPQDFWGYTTMLTTIDDLLETVHLSTLHDAGYDYSLMDAKYGVISGNETLVDPASVPVVFADPISQRIFAEWELRLEPTGGWPMVPDLFAWQCGLFGAALLMSTNTGMLLLFRLQTVKALKKFLAIFESGVA